MIRTKDVSGSSILPYDDFLFISPSSSTLMILSIGTVRLGDTVDPNEKSDLGLQLHSGARLIATHSRQF